MRSEDIMILWDSNIDSAIEELRDVPADRLGDVRSVRNPIDSICTSFAIFAAAKVHEK